MTSTQQHRHALVLGASGHIGNAICRELAAHGWQVIAATRQQHAPHNLRDLPVTVRTTTDPCGADADWFGEADLVVDAATPYPVDLFDFSPGTRTPMEQADERTRTLLARCRRSGAVFTAISSFATLVPAPDDLLGQIARHPYFGVKRAIERAVLAAWERGQPVMLLNPTLCLGPWDLKPERLTLLPNLLNPALPLTLDHMVNVVDVREAATLLHKAYVAERFGERLLCAGHNVSMQELATLARGEDADGDTPATLPTLPGVTDTGVLGALLGETALAAIGQNSPFPALGLMLVRWHRELAPGAVQKALHVAPRPLQASVADSLRWYGTLGYC